MLNIKRFCLELSNMFFPNFFGMEYRDDEIRFMNGDEIFLHFLWLLP